MQSLINEPPDFETLVATIFFLMTRYARTNDLGLTDVINNHLQLLANHPDTKTKVMTDTCHRLQVQWHNLCNDKELNIDDTCGPYASNTGQFNVH